MLGLHGRVAVELGRENRGYAVLVQADGKSVIAGASSGSNGGAMNFALFRLDRNGALDTGFNGEGTVVTSLVPGDDEALAVGRLADGRLVAGGYSFNGRDRDFALACYRGNGTLDASFGLDGAVLTSIGNGNEEITALAVDSSDRIVAVGTSEGTSGRILVVARYLPSGQLDRGFGEQGIKLIGLGRDATAEGALSRRDGSLILAGSFVDRSGPRAMLVALHADGSLATGFGEQGVVMATSAGASEGYGVAEDSNGLLYLAGSVGEAGQRDAALFRFTAKGVPDPAFGGHGAAMVFQGPGDEVLYAITVTTEAVRLGGWTAQEGKRRMLLASFVPAPASAESAALPGTPEIPVVTTAFGQEDAVCYALVTDAEGRTVVVGTAEEQGGSSMVAGFLGGDAIDRLPDRPGHRSRHLVTLPATDGTGAAAPSGRPLQPWGLSLHGGTIGAVLTFVGIAVIVGLRMVRSRRQR